MCAPNKPGWCCTHDWFLIRTDAAAVRVRHCNMSKINTGYLSQSRAKLRDWAVRPIRAGWNSWAALTPSNRTRPDPHFICAHKMSFEARLEMNRFKKTPKGFITPDLCERSRRIFVVSLPWVPSRHKWCSARGGAECNPTHWRHQWHCLWCIHARPAGPWRWHESERGREARLGLHKMQRRSERESSISKATLFGL